MNNIVETIFKHFDLQADEEFQLMKEGNTLLGTYIFDEDGYLLVYYDNQKICWERPRAEYVDGIISGELKIFKKFDPKLGDKFWFPCCEFEAVDYDYWVDTPKYIAFKECGMIARTKEEMERMLPALRRKYLEGQK